MRHNRGTRVWGRRGAGRGHGDKAAGGIIPDIIVKIKYSITYCMVKSVRSSHNLNIK